jgi:hypothetical protein
VAPLEQQSFESLLSHLQTDVSQTPGMAEDAHGAADARSATDKARQVNPLSDLARVDQIQNASLRSLIADTAGRTDVAGQQGDGGEVGPGT